MPRMIVPPSNFREILRERRRTGADRYDEVWDGVYVASPPADIEHQDVATGLASAFLQAIDPPSILKVLGGTNISDQAEHWERNYRCPDVAVFLNGNPAENRKTHWLGGPDFAVEILSPRDRSRKKFGFYARVGVRELLLVSRNPWRLELYKLENGAFEPANVCDATRPQVLTSSVLPVTFRLVPAQPRPGLRSSGPPTAESGWPETFQTRPKSCPSVYAPSGIAPAMKTSLALASSLALILATGASASTPSLGGVRPQGAQRGTEVEVNLTGARLSDAKEILFYEPGITTTAMKVVNDGHVKATVKIAPDARLGLYDLRLRTASGISEMRSFSVGALKDLAETEPNNEFAKPQPIAMNVTVNGVADNEDVDFYAVKVKKGERITAEVEGIRLGVTMFDPYVAILDAKRFELSSSDDAALVWQDGFASVVAPAEGTYVVAVRESAYAGNGACLYRLHVGNFPRYTATIPAGGKFGDPLKVRWIGDVLGEITTDENLPKTPVPNFGIQARDPGGLSPYANAFRLSPFGNVVEAEPNDTHATATPFEPPMGLNGVIGKPGDVDHFVFKAAKGRVYDVRVFARQLRSPLDAVLYLGARNGGAMLGSDDSTGPDSYFRFQAPGDGEFVVWINDQLQKGGPDYFYRIEVTPVEPKLGLSIPNEGMVRGTGVIAVAVPKGNRQAILVNASRNDFGGELTLSAQGLPPGLTFDADTMAASIGTYPVLFSAAPDAPVAGRLATLSGKPVDPKLTIPCEFSQTVELVTGQNNIPFWTRTVDTFPVSVCDEAPYSIEIVEPKVPLVRGGSMNLKVVAKRKPGFTAAISVYLPWNPPGVGSAGGVVIPDKKDEALIPVNADGGAELRTWKIVVNGASSGPTGPLLVSSQLAKLTIAQPFLTLGFQAVSVEQGKDVDIAVKVNKAVDFPGEAQVTLVGLPNRVTTDVKTITKDTADLLFHLKTDKVSPAGNHTNLFCQVVVTQNGEPILHNLGTGQLRIDVPLPPKANAPAVAPKPVAAAPKPAAAPAKPLSRLEKLRQENKERKAAEAAK